jgi:hypothetical protein
MAVNVQGGGLYFDSGVDLTGLETDVKKANQIISTIGKDVKVSQFQNLNLELGKVKNSIETLRAMKLARENFLINETDISKIRKYNLEIDVLTKEINRLANAGKIGFDEFGNAIPKAIEKTTAKTNLLTKGFSFFRQAAYLIPGIGLAGIFNLIGEGVAALVTQLFKGGDATKTFAKNFENLKEVMANANKESGTQITDLKILYSAATNANLSLKDRKDAILALKAEFPDYFGKLSDEIILTGKAKQTYDDLVVSILNSSKARAAKAKLDDLEAQRLDVAFQKQKALNDAKEKSAKIDRSVTQVVDEKGNVVGGVGGVSSVQQQEAAAAQQLSKTLSKLFIDDAKIAEQQKFLIAFAGEGAITKVVVDENKKRIDANKKANEKTQSELLAILNERKKLLEEITSKQRDSFQSGLVKEDSIVDKLKESYELLIKKVEEFNQKARKKGIEQIDVAPILKAKDLEVANTIQKQQADEFIKSVEKQKDAFDQFEKYKLSVGSDNAKRLVDDQIGSFENYVDFIQAKLKELANDQSIGAIIKKDALTKLLAKAREDKNKQDQEDQANALKDVLSLTSQFEFARNQIEQKFVKLRLALIQSESTLTKEEFEKRSKDLDRLHKGEITNLENTMVRQGELYKKLGEDTINFTKSQLKARVDELKKILSTDTSLTPQMRKDILSTIDNLENLIVTTDKTVENLSDFITKASKIKGSLDGLSTALDPFNSDLSEAVKNMSTLLSSSIGVANGLKDFQIAKGKGDIAGQLAAATDIFSAILQGLNVIVQGVKKTLDAVKKTKEAVLSFDDQLIQGELEYQQKLRERDRLQAGFNKLTLDGVRAQKLLLESQKQSTTQTANDLLKQIQGLTYVVDVQGKKKSLFRRNLLELSGGATEIKEITASLAGKTFDQLEELFTKGQLTGKAKELFEQLQKLKQEGIDIDNQLEDLKKESQEIFTGTTADAILDSIVDGFRQGLHSASDFAGKFEDFMKEAMLNALKFQYLEGPVKELFASFAEKSESGGTLTKDEIEDLRKKYNAIITNANKQFEQLSQIAGVNLANSSAAQQNVLRGDFRQLTEDTGNALLGAFNGQRVASLQLLDVQKSALGNLNNIELNTANAVIELKTQTATIITYFRDIGVKMK